MNERSRARNNSESGDVKATIKKPISVWWVVVVAFMAVGSYFSLIITMLAGEKPLGSTVGAIIFWGSVLGFMICRYKLVRPIYGIFVGAILGFLAARFSGYVAVLFM